MQLCSYCDRFTDWAVPLPRDRWLCAGCRPLLWMRRNLRLPGDYGDQLFAPLNWFAEMVRNVYGRRDNEGKRLVEDVYLEIAKGNAKTTNFAALILESLCTVQASSWRIVSAASVKEQARVLYDYAEEMVYSSPSVHQLLQCVPSKGVIYRRDNPSINYKVLSSHGRGADGKDPSMVIRDELHLWKTEAHRMLFNVLENSAKIKRKNPLIIDITTAGAEDESPICLERHDYAIRMIEGVYPANPRFYGRIYRADPKRIETDPEYWKTKEAFMAANPAHEESGGFIRDTVRQDMIVQAQHNPAKQKAFLRYHLNYWGTFDASIIDWPTWQKCDGGVDLRDWPEYDMELLASKWNLVGKECYLGLDIGSTSDMTALVALFPPEIEHPVYPYRKHWAILAWYWMPEKRVIENERAHSAPYSEWVKKGFVKLASGARTDPDVIIPTVKEVCELFNVRQMGYDPANADHTVTGMREEIPDLVCFEVPQKIGHLNAPTKWLLDAYLEGLIWHGNNPVLNWNAKNLSLDYDSNDNVKPQKAANKASRKIDGISALVDAAQRARTEDEDHVPYYGLRSL